MCKHIETGTLSPIGSKGTDRASYNKYIAVTGMSERELGLVWTFSFFVFFSPPFHFLSFVLTLSSILLLIMYGKTNRLRPFEPFLGLAKGHDPIRSPQLKQLPSFSPILPVHLPSSICWLPRSKLVHRHRRREHCLFTCLFVRNSQDGTVGEHRFFLRPASFRNDKCDAWLVVDVR